jgi:2-aminoethylphosphonate dioxygenase
MNPNYLDYKKKFDIDGYFIFKNFLNRELVLRLVDDINKAIDVEKYFDNKNNLRRIEKIFNKGKNLIYLNDKILNLLKDIFETKFTIFKDKFNSKPPGGEGFFAHYDGIFKFKDSNDDKKNGWYEYADFFLNALLAIDKCDKNNGSIELAKTHKGNFYELYDKTKKDGTPALSKEVEARTSFDLIDLDPGDLIIFSNTCPHRSKKNNSNKNRRIIYYTYTLSENGSKYEEYFNDKKNSKGKSKALSEK